MKEQILTFFGSWNEIKTRFHTFGLKNIWPTGRDFGRLAFGSKTFGQKPFVQIWPKMQWNFFVCLTKVLTKCLTLSLKKVRQNVWLLNCSTVQLFDCLTAWLFNFFTVRLFDYLTVQLFNYFNLCLSKLKTVLLRHWKLSFNICQQ